MLPVDRPRLKWPRSQRFILSPSGRGAFQSWQEALAAAQGQGKTAFDSAQQAWAKSAGVQPDDVTVLSELADSQGKRLEDVVAALQDVGASREQVKSAVERLYSAQLVDPVAP